MGKKGKQIWVNAHFRNFKWSTWSTWWNRHKRQVAVTLPTWSTWSTWSTWWNRHKRQAAVTPTPHVEHAEHVAESTQAKQATGGYTPHVEHAKHVAESTQATGGYTPYVDQASYATCPLVTGQVKRWRTTPASRTPTWETRLGWG